MVIAYVRHEMILKEGISMMLWSLGHGGMSAQVGKYVVGQVIERLFSSMPVDVAWRVWLELLPSWVHRCPSRIVVGHE